MSHVEFIFFEALTNSYVGGGDTWEVVDTFHFFWFGALYVSIPNSFN